MNELTNATKSSNAKWLLLTSASAFALIATTSQALLAEEDHPAVWIVVGTEIDRLTDGQASFAPPFVSTLLANPFTPPAKVQKPPLYAFGEEGSLLFSPKGSSWIFSASVRYGRANGGGNSHEETTPHSAHRVVSIPYFGINLSDYVPAAAQRFATTVSRTENSHLVLDFQAGKDVGLGAFGTHGSSTISAGLRFAQFTSKSASRIDSDPDFAVTYKYLTTRLGHPANIKVPDQTWNLFNAKVDRSHSFGGLGPSVSWQADAMLVGNPDDARMTFDWGLNGALLFGRQKATAQHTTMAHHGSAAHASGALPTLYPTAVHSTRRSRSVLVPNVGAFAGLSLRFPAAKVSLGYRADAFFGAMDGGVDTRKTYDRGFYGPFATISIGLGG